jgi:hypothetical protein
MTAPLDPRTADKLAKLCGLFSSDHDGERASAAMADSLIRQRGLTWKQILLPGHSTVEETIEFARDHGDLNAWEEGFLRGIRGRQFLTEKQLAKLHAIADKVRAGRRSA